MLLLLLLFFLLFTVVAAAFTIIFFCAYEVSATKGRTSISTTIVFGEPKPEQYL